MQKYKVSNADLWCDAYLKQNKQKTKKNKKDNQKKNKKPNNFTLT